MGSVPASVVLGRGELDGADEGAGVAISVAEGEVLEAEDAGANDPTCSIAEPTTVVSATTTANPAQRPRRTTAAAPDRPTPPPRPRRTPTRARST